eukprot:CAMPEP_0202703934 /NCGR_PEP_ID=MMETSP1385-20130828/16715_1 /ASSEMBLY_ACC=CAM_ASM_000861 /TAXON_ID=933848 /ORGANISM="Elphidium margaritaceum" /LENGTH=231 /DNA_ID=CAMNT_0049361863 /DNA_START=129 /DNA_END=820 /DNA_ORIENTATION=+
MNRMLCDSDHCDRWHSHSIHHSCSIDATNDCILHRGNDNETNPFSFGEYVMDMTDGHSMAMIWKIRVLKPQLAYIGIVEVNDDAADADESDSAWCHLRDNAHILSITDGQLYSGQRRKLQKKYKSPKKDEFIFMALDSRFRELSIFTMRWQLLCKMDHIKASKYKLAIGLSSKASVELVCSYQTRYVQHDDLLMHQSQMNNICVWIKWNNYVKTSVIVDCSNAGESYKAIV